MINWGFSDEEVITETTTDQNENKIIDDYYYGCRYSTPYKNEGGK